jgi:(4S)-4-hydroxy-5-phosphonooxypentane-2,3-dione isomerase
MNGYVVTVEFRVEPDKFAGFLRLVTENARASAETEPGCQKFDVIVPDASANTVFLYEIYDDRPAFEQHLASAHFLAFDRRCAPMVRSKVVSTGGLHFASRPPKQPTPKPAKDSA